MEKITSEKIGEMTVRCYPSVRNTVDHKDLSLFLYLQVCQEDEFVKAICESLSCMDKAMPGYDETKKNNRCATISCICDQSRKDSHAAVRNPLIVLDVDLDDNDFLKSPGAAQNLSERLFELECVYATGLSCSGRGVYAIVYIGHNDDDGDFRAAFCALEKEFADRGVVIDKKCKNISRLRFASSYKPLIKKPHEIITAYQGRLADPEYKYEPKAVTCRTSNPGGFSDLDILSAVIDMLIESNYSTDDYNYWIHAAGLLRAYGHDGLMLFDRISAASSGYKDFQEVRRKFDEVRDFDRTNSIDKCNAYFFGLAKKVIGAGWKYLAAARIQNNKRNNI